MTLSRSLAQPTQHALSVKALEGPCQQARHSFQAWITQASHARAIVEASARNAVADCYRFGLQALEDPAIFDLLCQGLAIRTTRSDRATNPFIRVVKAVFGQTVEDGNGGPPRWEWVSDSQINKYATVMLYAHTRGITAHEVGRWLAEDWATSGEAVPMSISRRLREAREALRHSPQSLALPTPPRLDRAMVLAAVDDLPPNVEVTPLTLRGLGAPDDAALILSLGEEDAVRLSHLPEELLVQVLGTISRYYRRADAQKEPSDQPFQRLATLFRQCLSSLGSGASLRVVNHQDHCAVLMGGAEDGLLVRADLPALSAVPRRRVFALGHQQARIFVQAFAALPPGESHQEVFQETNFSRPGGLLEQRILIKGTTDPQTVPLLEIPDSAAGDPLASLPLSDIGITQWDGCALLNAADLAALARADSRAKRWKETHTTRTGSTITRRASRIFDVTPGLDPQQPTLTLSLRRGPADDRGISLSLPHGTLGRDRIGRSALGSAAQLMLKRHTTDQAVLFLAYGALWVLSGVNGKTGERLTVGIPVLDAAGRPVARGLREARFESEAESYTAVLRRAGKRLGVSPSRFTENRQ